MRPLESLFVKRTADVLIASNVLPANLDPELFEVSVHYPEPKIVKSTQDQIQQDNFDLEHGITTRAEIYMRRHPDQFDSEDEAELFLRAREVMLAQNATEGGSEPNSPVGDEPPTTSGGETVDDNPADEAMNGAQVQALQGLVESVANGEMPAESAKIVARNAFPTIPETELETMFNTAETFEPDKPDPKPNPFGLQPPVAPNTDNDNNDDDPDGDGE